MIFRRIRAVLAFDQFAIALGAMSVGMGMSVLNDAAKRRRTELAQLNGAIADRRADVVALDERVAERLAQLDDIANRTAAARARAYPNWEDVNPLHTGEDDRG